MKTYTNQEIISEIHQENVKARSLDWAEDEFIRYSQKDNAIVDENGKGVNALVFVVNEEWELLEYEEHEA